MPDNELPNRPIKRTNKHWLWVVLIVLFLVGGFFIFVVRSFLPGGDGVVARATSPDNTEMCVVQTYNSHWAEPYTVSFYYRKPSKPWGWFYYEHEDLRWSFGKIILSNEGKLAHILCEGREVAQFDVASESFTINRWKRTTSPAQRWMPDGWKPEDALVANQNEAKSPMMAVGAPNNSPPGYQWK